MAGGAPTDFDPRPDILVIVLDCVRASSFLPIPSSNHSFPTFASLEPQCTRYSRATSVAPWTLPSHASLFTGTYPWVHGVLGERSLQFDATVPSVAGLLREAGYATIALSANGLIEPLLSGANSFEEHRSAEWWEKTFRWIPAESLSREVAARPRDASAALAILSQGVLRRRARRGPSDDRGIEGAPEPNFHAAISKARPEELPLGTTAELAMWAMIEGSNRIVRSVTLPDDPRPLSIASWIEPTLDGWLSEQPTSRPVHCFVNLVDAHEKYLSDGRLVNGLTSWIKFIRTSQNVRHWLEGSWQPTGAELELMTQLYESTIEVLDRRVGRILSSFQHRRRWRNVLVIITSDHGQAFGEHGELFHERSPYEVLLNVPLWIKWPGQTIAPGPSPVRASLVDVSATVLGAAGISSPPNSPGLALFDPMIKDRREPVLAYADGFPSIEVYRKSGNPRVLARLSSSYAVAYLGDLKSIASVSDGTVATFDLSRDPNEAHPLGSGSARDRALVEEAALQVRARISSIAQSTIDDSVHERLHSWGYT